MKQREFWIYAGIRGRSAWWNRTVDIPKEAVSRKSSMAGGPVLLDDGTFGLIFFEIPTDEGISRAPLKVRVTLSTTKEKAEPVDADNPCNPPENPKNQLDD